MITTKYANVDEYIAGFSGEIQEILLKVRQIFKELAPDASETISYGIPTYKTDKILGHFAGYKTHIGFYPGPKTIEAFESDLKEYKTSKGTVQFSIDKPIPYDLIRKMISANM